MIAGVRVLALLLLVPLNLPRAPGQLTLRNDSWDAVQVEVRVGTSGQCDTNEVAGVRTLARDRRWVVIVNGVVCWRREAQPGSGNGQWTAWQSGVVPPGAVQEASL